MRVGKTYKILGESLGHRPELQPEGKIVECVEDKGNDFFIVKLVDKCGKENDETVKSWVVNIKNIKYVHHLVNGVE